MDLIKTASFNLACQVVGQANAERLALILPGRLDTKDYSHMLSHVEFMAARGYLAVSFDPPGTWESDGDISLYTETNYAKAIDELIEHFGNKPTVLIGHSRGGSMAMLVGCLNPTVISFVAIMSNLKPSRCDEERVKNGVIYSVRDLPEESDAPGKKEFYLPLSYYKDSVAHERISVLKSCTKPKLFIAGLRDQLVSIETVKQAYEAAAEPRLYAEVDCGHDYRRSPVAIKQVEVLIGEFLSNSMVCV